jgi:hypothetical protein
MREPKNNELEDYCNNDLSSPVVYMKRPPMDLNIYDDDDDYLSDDDDDDLNTHFDDDDY